MGGWVNAVVLESLSFRGFALLKSSGSVDWVCVSIGGRYRRKSSRLAAGVDRYGVGLESAGQGNSPLHPHGRCAVLVSAFYGVLDAIC